MKVCRRCKGSGFRPGDSRLRLACLRCEGTGLEPRPAVPVGHKNPRAVCDAEPRLHLWLAALVFLAALALLQISGPEPANPADAKVTPQTVAPFVPFLGDL